MFARAEVVVDFDGEEWGGEIEDTDFDQRVLKEGICIVADDESEVGKLLESWGLDQLQPHAIRFVLRGVEGKGALIDSGKGMEGDRKASIVVTCEQAQVTVAHVSEKVGFVETASMDVDLDGADKFLEIVRQGVRASENAREAPVAVLMIRSKCSYGLMVRVLQLMRAGGCRMIAIKVDDVFPSMDIEVRVDPNILPPIAKPEMMEKLGRVTLNLRGDGSVTGKDLGLLETDEDIKKYVERCRDEILKSGKEPRLFLRGDQEAVFKQSRRVIRIGAEAGVEQVIFAVDKNGEKKDDDLKQNLPKDEKAPAPVLREMDLKMSLPSNELPIPPKRELVVRVESGGRIFMETGDVELDADPKDRELPLFRAALKKAKAEGEGLGLQLRIDPSVEQSRVIAILNACAAEGISMVTFAD